MKRKEAMNWNVINGWRYQIDRSKINDYFEQGDLERLFDESHVIETFRDPKLVAREKRR